MKLIMVISLPECDICHTPARYDMPLREGRWANLCRECALLYTYLPLWELKGYVPGMGSEYRQVVEVELPHDSPS